MALQRLSLRAQALAWLAQREHSELELRRKLIRRLRGDARAVGTAGQTGESPPASDANEQLDDLIGWLIERGYLNEQRFIASRLHVRSGRHGVMRIEQELARHGLSIPPDEARELRLGEYEHAMALWQRRFGAPPADAREAARQARFLAGRGYAAEVVRRVLRTAGRHDPPVDAGAPDEDAAAGPARLAPWNTMGPDDPAC